MPSTEQIHDGVAAYHQELSELPGFAEANQKIYSTLRKLVEDFHMENGIKCPRDWEFTWAKIPQPVQAMRSALMADFPGVKELKEKYKWCL